MYNVKTTAPKIKTNKPKKTTRRKLTNQQKKEAINRRINQSAYQPVTGTSQPNS